MAEEKLGHLTKLPIEAISEEVLAEPKVKCPSSEVLSVLKDLRVAVENRDYQPQTPTEENPSLSDDYIFDTDDQNYILMDLTEINFVGKDQGCWKRGKKEIRKRITTRVFVCI